MSKDEVKVRTSITISPELLSKVRRFAKDSVSSYIETALKFYMANAPKSETGVQDDADQ